MGFPSITQICEAAKRLSVSEDGAFLRTNGLWHVLMFLRHRACHDKQEQYTFESYDLAQATFDLNGVSLPIEDSSRNVYFEPGATSGNVVSKFFRHREGPRQTYLNRIYTGLVGNGPRQPKLFTASSNSLPTTVALVPNWSETVRESAQNIFILDSLTHELITWIFRFGVPVRSGQTAHLAEHLGNGKMKPALDVNILPLPTNQGELESQLCQYFALTSLELKSLFPKLDLVRTSEWTQDSHAAYEDLGPSLMGFLEKEPVTDAKPRVLTGIIPDFIQDSQAVGLQVGKEITGRFLASLLSKRFLILTGLAGSGKTKLAQAFARWITPEGVSGSPFFPGSKIQSDRITYHVAAANDLAVEFWNSGKEEDATKVVLPLAMISEWADHIAENALPEETPARAIREAVKSKSRFSDQLHSFETHLKAAAYALVKARNNKSIERCYEIVPVGADWTGSENIIGYPDGLDRKSYVSTPALNLILHAIANQNIPHFLILDEMNLSHVERYFADFLSAIESSEGIPLYSSATGENGAKVLRNGIPERLKLPENLFVIGTVNVDETTYLFSPKVLDRANVIEFRMDGGDLKEFLDNPIAPKLEGLDGKGAGFGEVFVGAGVDRSIGTPAAVKEIFGEEFLLFFHLLRRHEAEFGYRMGYESARFFGFFKLLGGYPDEDDAWFSSAMDAVIVQKVLPKLHGSRAKLEGLLWALAWACGLNREDRAGKSFSSQLAAAGEAQDEVQFGPENVWNKFKEIDTEDPARAAHFPLSYDKVMRMWRKLVRDQFVNFAEA